MANSKDVPLKETLAMLMEEREWTVGRLSRDANVPRATLTGWMNGADPRGAFPELMRVAKVLGVTFQFLCLGHDDLDFQSLLRRVPQRIELDGLYHITMTKIGEQE